ncbi:helix-turn-helix domain-containing protein [Urbifossiella limnaea]|uniref:Uncharacterized protein n=1 Tax=Urbifossiella limnaea TaxID=2528023 RepID=A0A517XPK3_9BACT|nr:helix-turn-helix domain-containing protein [Urbifossiella limnaea]QDU19439.1 hypothetical protein ETAA1_13630 [Urbifossiella limnaea]
MTGTPVTTVVAGDEALAEFRRGLDGPSILRHLAAANGPLLVGLPVGVGKSHALDAVAAELAATEPDTLVLVTAPRTDILVETRGRLRALGLAPVNLDRRPRKRCGPLDAEWAELEQLGCAALARRDLCGRCPHQSTCDWLSRWKGLSGSRLVLAAQQHLATDPHFVRRVQAATGAADVVTLVDESDLLLRPFRRHVAGPDLHRFADAAAATGCATGAAWAEACRTLLAAGDDLYDPWQFPGFSAGWAADVAAAGRAAHRPAFRFVAYDVAQFGRSDPSTRDRLPDGGVRFALPPVLGDRSIVFSGSAAPGLVRFRLDPDHRRGAIAAPFADYRFAHPGTRWVNLANAAGTAKYFPANAGRILDVFARLVARNITNRKTTLLVCKKQFREHCQSAMQRRVKALVGGTVRVVTKGWERYDLTDPRVIPLITYGVSGINRFELHDAVYCLTGYYAAPAAVECLVNDFEPAGRRVAVRLTFGTNPPRRAAVVEDPAVANTIVPQLAAWALEQKEADVVVQAVGRVRPFTRPREVVTFQVGALPGAPYDLEFRSPAELRAHFGLPTPAERRLAARVDQAAEAARLRAGGTTRREIGAALGVSLATVKRLLKAAKGGAQSAS